MTQQSQDKPGGLRALLDELPLDRLKDELQDAAKAAGEKAISSAGGRIEDATGRLNDVTAGGGVVGKAAQKGAKAAAEGDSPVGGAVKGALSGAKDKVKDKVKDAVPGMSGGSGGGGGKATKAMNIVETIDVGVPISVAYNQWTQYDDWSSFMKKVEHAEQEDDEAEATFKAQVFWSHRTWEATIEEQVPDDRIVWRSTGEKGHVDGSVTFHELGPRLTRILVVLEYYPQGFMERTGNIWRAPGRRARLELKHFRRHVMMNTILDPDAAEGWRGEIHDGEVTRTHDEVVEEEQAEAAEEDEEPADGEDEEEAPAEDEDEEEPADEEEYEEEEPAEDEDEEPVEEEEYEDEEPAEEEEYEEEEPAEGEYEEEPARR